MTSADKAQLRQVRAAILGNRPDTSLSSTLYPVYVAFIVAGFYGVGASQQLFTSFEAQWLADHVWSLRGAIASVTIAALLLTLVRVLGGVRGPVVPPLPYLELVVASPMPRKLTLGRHWRLSLGGSALRGLLVGLVIGAGAVINNLATSFLLLPATLGGGLFGVLAAEFWLRGQLHGQPLVATAGSGRGSSAGFPNGSSVLSKRRNALALLDITGLYEASAPE